MKVATPTPKPIPPLYPRVTSTRHGDTGQRAERLPGEAMQSHLTRPDTCAISMAFWGGWGLRRGPADTC